MGTAKSIITVRDPVTKEIKLVPAGPTESQVRKAKLLGKKPEELTKEEMQTPIEYYIEKERKKAQKKG